MSKINAAYFKIAGNLDSSVCENVVKKGGKVFTMIDDNNITGSYCNTFCVYS